jgi:hypothetical protein
MTTSTRNRKTAEPTPEPEPTSWRVVWPSATVIGITGSQHLFYQDDVIRPWPCGTTNTINHETSVYGQDEISPESIQKLSALGAIERVV